MNRDEDKKKIGDLFEINIKPIPVSISLVVLVLFFGGVIAYLAAGSEKVENGIIFIFSVLTALGAIYSAFYVGRTLRVHIAQKNEDLHQKRISNSIQWIKEFKEREYLKYRIDIEHMIIDMKEEKKCDTIDGIDALYFYDKIARNENLLLTTRGLLNKIEGMSLAIQFNHADEAILYRDLSGIVITIFADLKHFVTQVRDNSHLHNKNLILCEAEKLVNSWKRGVYLSSGNAIPEVTR